ncbi:MAG: tetratricopeptide repeat protein [Candidatus Riflebacteria bacterium]|nr:tetratricopeptide repeat protein [Candidatus Riflebacteria bacterium]
MLKKMLTFAAAALVAVAMLPSIYSGDPGITGAIVKDRERYYHRLKDMRAKDPQNAELSYQIANLYYSLQMEDEAIKEYRRTLRVDPNHSHAKWFLTRLLVSKGYFEEAFWLVRDLISANSENPELYARAGEILLKMDQREVAKEYFNRYDELKFGEKNGADPMQSFSKPVRGTWKEYFY